jgi:predicted MFS family arabinose efflux permease
VQNTRTKRDPSRGGRADLVAVAVSDTFVFLGHFTLYTFISLVLLRSGITPALVGPILLVLGGCGLAGVWFSGRNVDRNPRRTIVAVLAVLIAGVLLLGGTAPAVAAVIAAAAVWNGAFGGVPTLYQACAVRTHAVSPELAGAWINAVSNIGIAGGAAIGAGLLSSVGLWSLPWVSAALVGVGLLVILVARRAFPAQPQRTEDFAEISD